jgi:hypothetical protein
VKTPSLPGGGEDRLYTYDGLDRLVDAKRGDLNAAGDATVSYPFHKAG